MVFVEQRDGSGEIELAPEVTGHAAHTVQRHAVADQDAQRALGRGGGNLHRNLAHDALAAVGTEHGFDDDVVAGAGFGHVGADALQLRRLALAHHVEVQLDALHLGLAVRVLVDAPEAVPQRHGGSERGGKAGVGGREHVLQADLGVAVDVDLARHAVGDVLTRFVHAL